MPQQRRLSHYWQCGLSQSPTTGITRGKKRKKVDKHPIFSRWSGMGLVTSRPKWGLFTNHVPIRLANIQPGGRRRGRLQGVSAAWCVGFWGLPREDARHCLLLGHLLTHSLRMISTSLTLPCSHATCQRVGLVSYSIGGSPNQVIYRLSTDFPLSTIQLLGYPHFRNPAMCKSCSHDTSEIQRIRISWRWSASIAKSLL